ncbi:hypothetical protein Poly24_40610 [Rosistilla carotiformis]|uniref:Uncharacterized protein n=1 Tax=Rosistilla carotiformis TaxID=2528017 RepID=A0A518JXS3_9BACT|nr:HTH domain-containing protein [Rosistilla carotiformis]QDV70340.1 hypothetical protein Poly24_40610 [Rosistilla carotiformis]
MSMGTQRTRHPRLLRLIALERRDETIKTLAKSLGVGEKTVRRDIAGLRQLPFAIQEYAEQNGRKTYSLSRDAIEQVRFTYDEAFSLMICQAGTSGFEHMLIGDASRSAFEKIRVALGGNRADYFERISPWLLCSPGDGNCHERPSTRRNHAGDWRERSDLHRQPLSLLDRACHADRHDRNQKLHPQLRPSRRCHRTRVTW